MSTRYNPRNSTPAGLLGSLGKRIDTQRSKGPGKPKTGFEGTPPSTKDAGPLSKPKSSGGEFKKNPPPRDITYKPPKKSPSTFLTS